MSAHIDISEGARLSAGGKFAVEAVCFGPLAPALKDRLLTCTRKLVHFTDASLASYSPEGNACALAGYAKEMDAKMIVAGATGIGRDFLPRAAVILGAGMISDATAANWDNDPLTFIGPQFGGKVFAEVSFAQSPVIVTMRPNSFSMEMPGGIQGEYVERSAGLPDGTIHTKLVRRGEAKSDVVDLTEADLIVAGGRGLKAAENFKALKELGAFSKGGRR